MAKKIMKMSKKSGKDKEMDKKPVKKGDLPFFAVNSKGK